MSHGVARRVRAGWTAAALVAGVVLAVAGIVLLRIASGPRELCHMFGSLDDLADGLQDAQPFPRPSCSALDDRYYIAAGLACAGVLLGLVGLVAMVRRARSSRRAGHPWWPGRVVVRLGRTVGVSPGIASVLLVTLLIAAVSAAGVGWDKMARTLESRSRHHGEAALAALNLPVGITAGSPDGSRMGCTPSPDTLCASSTLAPAQVEPMLRRLLHGKPDPAICGLIPAPSSGRRPCAIYGRIGGYRAMAIAFDHLLVLRRGASPPPGAVPVRPGSTLGFYFGTDITIGLLTPTS